MDAEFIIEMYSDGWAVLKDGEVIARWNHNEEDLGTNAVEKLISYLGSSARIVEVC